MKIADRRVLSKKAEDAHVHIIMLCPVKLILLFPKEKKKHEIFFLSLKKSFHFSTNNLSF